MKPKAILNKFPRAAFQAQGYLELAMLFPEGHPHRKEMVAKAADTLSVIIDDDDYIDQLYEEWLKEEGNDPFRENNR